MYLCDSLCYFNKSVWSPTKTCTDAHNTGINAASTQADNPPLTHRSTTIPTYKTAPFTASQHRYDTAASHDGISKYNTCDTEPTDTHRTTVYSTLDQNGTVQSCIVQSHKIRTEAASFIM